jgi:hypothetical protein
MVKVKFKDGLNRSYYDTETDTIFLRTNFKHNKEFVKVLQHEITHALLKKTWLNILYEFRTVFMAIILITITTVWGYYSDVATFRNALGNCIKLLPFNQYGIMQNYTNLNLSGFFIQNASFNNSRP